MLLAAAYAPFRTTVLRSAAVQSAIKRHMSLATSVASLKGVDFMSIDQLRCAAAAAGTAEVREDAGAPACLNDVMHH